MPGHPDFDAGVIWQAPPLYSQVSGNFPAAGTVLFSGPITDYPSLLLRCQATQGGVRLIIEWFLDAALTLSTGNDVFDAPQLQGFYALYEVQAPFVKIRILNVTVAPAGQGLLLILPTRSPALGFRPLVTPQVINVSNVVIPGNTTNTYKFGFTVIGLMQFIATTISVANSINLTIDFLNYDGSSAGAIFGPANLIVGFTQSYLLIAAPMRVQLQNVTANPVTVTVTAISQEQGW